MFVFTVLNRRRKGLRMDNKKVAQELLKVAKSLMAAKDDLYVFGITEVDFYQKFLNQIRSNIYRNVEKINNKDSTPEVKEQAKKEAIKSCESMERQIAEFIKVLNKLNQAAVELKNKIKQ